MNFVTDYPFWFVLLCAILGGIYTFLFYFRTKREDINPWIKRSMMVFRFLAITIISFLLLSPLIRKNKEVIDKPLIIFAQDNSRSVVLSADSSWYRNTYPGEVVKLSENLSGKFETVILTFGDKVSRGLNIDFTESQTDMSLLFDEVNSRFANRNIGALIVASDGIYNKGTSPLYLGNRINYPVYTVALGDTTVYRDIILKKVNYNKTVYVGDRFPVEVIIEGNRVQGESSDIQIIENDKVVAIKRVSFASEKYFQKTTFLLETKESGIKKYTVRINAVNDELSLINNSQDIFVEITNTRQKVAILYSSPHPDIAAIRSALEGSAKYEVEEFNISGFNESPEKYDLIIFSQLPSTDGYFPLEKFLTSNVSLLFILGAQSSIDVFNGLKTGLSITGFKGSYTETLPVANPDFALFTLGKNVTDFLGNVPPLLTPFGNYQYSPVADILLFQKIGNVQSKIPQILFIQSPDKKICIIAGENIWKWRFSNYLQNENHIAFDELIEKMVQFLSVKGDKSFFRLRINNRFMENEDVVVEADVFNESYDLINDPDVNFNITDSEGKRFPFVMGKTGKGYHLNAGNFNSGTYEYDASVKVGKNTYSKKGKFMINMENLEAINTIADHNLLYRLSSGNNGKMLMAPQLLDLTKILEARGDIKPVSYFQKRYTDLIGNLVVFLVILGLLSAEWFLRKRSGNY